MLMLEILLIVIDICLVQPKIKTTFSEALKYLIDEHMKPFSCRVEQV